MDIKKLKYAVTLRDEGSFGKAATKLHLSQSALTRSIQALENELGIQLFNRHANGISLTTSGKSILEKAQEILKSVNGLSREAEFIRECKQGSLTIGIAPVPGQLLLPELLTTLFKNGDKISIHVQTEPPYLLWEMLFEESIEFFIASIDQLPSNSEEAEIVYLGSCPVGFFVRRGHPLLSTQKPNKEIFLDYPLIGHVLTDRQLSSTPTNDANDPLLHQWPNRLSCENILILTAVAQDTNSILMTSEQLIERELANGELHPLTNPCLPPLEFADIGLVYLRERTLSPLAKEFIDKTKSSASFINRSLAKN